MRITNNQNLPDPLYQAIVAQEGAHQVGDALLSCTQLIDPPLIAWLRRKYGDQVEEDASDRLWALYGLVAHKILENYEGKGHHVEVEAIAEVEGYKISGHIDLLVFPDGTLQDYKFTSATTVKFAKQRGKPEWERQLNVYRYLLRHDPSLNLPPIERMQIIAMLRDYGPRFKQEGLRQVEVLDVPVWENEKIEQYMRERVRLHVAALGMEPPSRCTAEERWESRGQSRRCLDYCPFGKQSLCPYPIT